MTTTPATAKQINYLISLSNQTTGRRDSYLSQVRGVLGISTSKANRGLTKSEASAMIDDLKSRAA